jgi:hypothetical protein
MLFTSSKLLLAWCAIAAAVPYKNFRAFENVKRQAISTTSDDPTQVDLGYAVYQGYNNNSLNIFKG